MLRGRGPPQHLNSDIVIKFWPPETREGVCQELGGHQERVHAGDHHYCHQHQAGSSSSFFSLSSFWPFQKTCLSCIVLWVDDDVLMMFLLLNLNIGANDVDINKNNVCVVHVVLLGKVLTLTEKVWRTVSDVQMLTLSISKRLTMLKDLSAMQAAGLTGG